MGSFWCIEFLSCILFLFMYVYEYVCVQVLIDAKEI